MGREGLARGSAALCATLALGALSLLSWAPLASADSEFCAVGAGAGQCAAPGSLRGLALDYASGRLYVADQNNHRVDVFEEDGDFLFAFGWGVADGATSALQACGPAATPPTLVCFKGLPGSGSGQLNKPTKVAVDNDPGSPSQHAVYVVDPLNFRVQKFDPAGGFEWMIGKGVDKTDGGDLCAKAEAHSCGEGAESEAEGGFNFGLSAGVGPGGVLHMLDNLPLGGVKSKHRLQRFKDSGEPISPPAQCILLEEGRAVGIAVDSSGSSWVASQFEGRGIRKYDPNCAKTVGPIDTDVVSFELALDESGNFFAAQREGRDKALGSFLVITAHNPAGEILSRFAYGRIPSSVPEGLAVRSNGGVGGIFVSPSEFPSLGIGGIKRLDFLPPAPALPFPGPVTAPPSLEVEDLGSTKATAVAEVNPEGKASEVHVEYVGEATYLKDIEELGAGHGFDHAKATASKPLGAEGFNLKAFEELLGCPDPASEAGEPGSECLTPETAYRWRVVATNADGEGEGPVEGPPFTTGESLELGEIYATRVGTDTARLNGEINPNSVPATGFFEFVDDATYLEDIEAGGDGFTAATKAPNVDKGQAPLDFGAGEGLATRQVAIYPLAPGTLYHYRLVGDNPLIDPVTGEEVKTLRTFEAPQVDRCPNDASRIGSGAFLPDCRAYEMVSPLDKAGGDIRVLTNSLAQLAVLEQSSVAGEKLAYGSVRSFGDALSAPFTSQYIAQRIAGEEWRTHSINPPRERPLSILDEAEFKAFSADLCEGWLTTSADPPLAPGAPEKQSSLYRRADEFCGEDGKTHYEWLVPGATLRGLSADGTHAIFSTTKALLPEGSEGVRQLYEHVRGEGLRFVCTLPGGEAESGPCTEGSASPASEPGVQQRAISSDGQRVFWAAPGTGGGKIYVRIAGTQTVAVSSAAEATEGTDKSWFWGAAADGSKAVFSTGDLSNGNATLYEFDVDSKATDPIAGGVRGVMGVSEDGGRVYFASDEALPGAGQNSEGDEAQAGQPNLYLAEGETLSFIATLAGADLTQAVSNEPYRRRSARVSPDGAHAAFISVAPLTGYDNKGAVSGKATEEIYRYDAVGEELLCVSCNPSGARPAGSSTIPFFETGMYGARVLSEDGSRLYFQSADALAARDSNGRIDVYQWEEPGTGGTGGCDEEDAGFSADAGGCVELVSSGQSPQDSRFVEASPTGGDVFFATVASLLPQDFGVFDIYDARVNGGLPIPPPRIPPCEGDACHAQIPAPEEPTPASSNYAPPAEAAEGKPGKQRCAKGKHRVSRKGRSRCVPKHKARRAQR